MDREFHGLARHPLYPVWRSIKSRCLNPEDGSYKNYGGRGISVCEAWQERFLTFYFWAVSNGWMPGLSINRIDNNGNYEPSNCEWTTAERQANNRRSSRMISAFGETKSLADWGRDPRAAVAADSILRRIDRYGWTSEQAITTQSLGSGRGRKSHPELG